MTEIQEWYEQLQRQAHTKAQDDGMKLGVQLGVKLGRTQALGRMFERRLGRPLDEGERQVLADRIEFLRAVFRERLAGFSPLLPAVYGGFSLEAADVSRRVDLSTPGRLYGASLFVSAGSALGPLYLGTGFAARGFVSLYLYLGRP